MRNESYWDTSDTLSQADDRRVAEDYVWATSEQARLRAFSLYVIRSIVERRGGTIDIDLTTDTIHINAPEEEEVACAQEIEEQMSAISR